MTIKRRSLLLLASAALISPIINVFSKAFGQNQCVPPNPTAIYPNVGAGNTLVAIAGSGFTGATAVAVGSAAVQSFTVVSDTQINAYMPFLSDATRSVFVTTSQGTSSGTLQFTHGPASIASLPVNPDLPNPFVFNSGTAVTTKAQWALRQFELRELWATYWTGHIPPPSAVTLLGVVDDSTITTTIGSNNTMRHLQVNLQTSGPNGVIQFGFNMFIPLHSGSGPFPILFSGNWGWSPLMATPSSSFSASLGANSINTLVNRGYILAEMSYDQFSLDNGDTSPPEGIFTLNTRSDSQLGGSYPSTQPFGPGATGNGVAPVNPISNQTYAAYGLDRNGGPTVTFPSFITAGLNTPPSGAGGVTAPEIGVGGWWIWGTLRCIDYIEQCSAAGAAGFNVPVDLTKICVTGISHDEAGFPAAAYDTRIAACMMAQGMGIFSGSRLCEFEGNMGGSGPPPPTTNDPNDGTGENQVSQPPISVTRYLGSAVMPTGSSTTVFQNFERIPADTHTLMAMIAPRGFMAVANYIGAGGIDSPRACSQKFLTGRTAYAALGAPTVPWCWCSDNNSISGVTNGHILTTAQYTQMLNYLDHFFNGTALPADVSSPAGSQSYWCNTQADFNSKVPGTPINGSTLTSNTALGFTWTPPSSLT